jgi:thioredoxin reductase (NADPH)
VIKPVILIVDDDPEVLHAIDRDLRRHYRGDYRVVRASSGAEALDAARQLCARGTPVALFLVDQRMPEMSGTEFLRAASKLCPDARKVLLTAYADTEAAIVSINEVGLDHYLLKPWDPPEQRLYPVLDELLSEWTIRVRLPYDGIRVAGSQLSPQCFAVREFLARNQVPYQWLDIERDETARELVLAHAGNLAQLPVVFFPDGTHLVAPGVEAIAEKAGMQTRARLPHYDLVVIGAGPSGLANALYGASEGLATLLVEQHAPGGQAGTSSMIENYLGFPSGVTGADLAQRAAAQARRFGAEILAAQRAVDLRREDPYWIVKLDSGVEVSCYAVVLATGMAVRPLEAPGVAALLGRGIYYGAAMSEAAAYRGRDVCVVGGANSAGQAALFFSRYARRVTMLVRAPALSPTMSRYLVDRVSAIPNIEVLNRVEVAAVRGDQSLQEVVVRDIDTGERRSLSIEGMFVLIGVAPHSAPFDRLLDCDDKGFILTGPDLPRTEGKPRGWTLDRDPFLFETCVPGVFAVGDVRSGANRRVAAAVGEGSAAIYTVHKYLQTV